MRELWGGGASNAYTRPRGSLHGRCIRAALARDGNRQGDSLRAKRMKQSELALSGAADRDGRVEVRGTGERGTGERRGARATAGLKRVRSGTATRGAE